MSMDAIWRCIVLKNDRNDVCELHSITEGSYLHEDIASLLKLLFTESGSKLQRKCCKCGIVLCPSRIILALMGFSRAALFFLLPCSFAYVRGFIGASLLQALLYAVVCCAVFVIRAIVFAIALRHTRWYPCSTRLHGNLYENIAAEWYIKGVVVAIVVFVLLMLILMCYTNTLL